MLRDKLTEFLEHISEDTDFDTHNLEAVIRSAERSPIDPEDLRSLVGRKIEQHIDTNITWKTAGDEYEGYRYASEDESVECTLEIYRAEKLLDWEEYQQRWYSSQEATDGGMARLEIEANEPDIIDSITETLIERESYQINIYQYS